MTRITERRILTRLRDNEPSLLTNRTSKWAACRLARKSPGLELISFPAFVRVTLYALTQGALSRWRGARTTGSAEALLFTEDGRAAV